MHQSKFTALRWKGLLLLAILGGLLLLVACGGGEEESTSSPTLQGTTTARPTQTAAPSPTRTASATSPAASPTGGSGGGLKVCSLLTKAEVEAAIGKAVAEPKEEVAGPVASCLFPNPAQPVFRLADVSVVTNSNNDQAKAVYNGLKAGGGSSRDVSGLGEGAFWTEAFGLQVLKGKYVLTIVVDPEIPNRQSVAQGLAQKALARLP